MALWSYLTAWVAAGFVCGSIPFGYLVSRARGVDIRAVGSGNIGMTNVWRTLGWQAGATVLVLDLLKGFLPVALAGWYLTLLPLPVRLLLDPHRPGSIPLDVVLSNELLQLGMVTGIAAVLGHTFPPWLRFKGGKGIATGGGVFIALLGVWSLVPVGVFGLTLAATRMVSAASLLAAYSAVVVSALVAPLRLLLVLIVPLALFVTWTHRDNIARIRAGTERRVGVKRTPE